MIAVVGGADDDEIGKAYDMGVTAVFPINRLPQDFPSADTAARRTWLIRQTILSGL